MTRFGVHQAFSGNDLTRDAVTIALRDAGAELGDIDAAYFGNTAHGLLEGRQVATGQIALRSMGFERIPIINVENSCATGATALHQAALHVRARAADVVIAVGADKTSVDGKQSLLVPFNSRVDVHDAGVQAVTHKPRHYAGTGGAERRSVFKGDCADVLRAHIQSFGTTKHQLASVSQKNNAHAVPSGKRQVEIVEQGPSFLAHGSGDAVAVAVRDVEPGEAVVGYLDQAPSPAEHDRRRQRLAPDPDWP